MKNQKEMIIYSILLRLHYIVLVAFAFLLWFESKTEYAVTVSLLFLIYVIVFEIFLYRKNLLNKKNAKDIISILEYPANKKLEKFPLPVAVSDAQNNILWMNGLLFDLLGEANVKSLSKITGIDEKIPTTEFTEADAFGKKFYVYTSLSTENEDLKIHYFIDVFVILTN